MFLAVLKMHRKLAFAPMFRLLLRESSNGFLLSSRCSLRLGNVAFGGSPAHMGSINSHHGTAPSEPHFQTGNFSTCSRRRPQAASKQDEDHCGDSGATGDRGDPCSPGAGSAPVAQKQGARRGARVRRLSCAGRRNHCPDTSPRGCIAALQPGWRCALCRHALANIRVNPETGPILRAVNLQRPANSPAPSRQTLRLRAESAQTCVLRPSAGSAGSYFRPFLGASYGV